MQDHVQPPQCTKALAQLIQTALQTESEEMRLSLVQQQGDLRSRLKKARHAASMAETEEKARKASARVAAIQVSKSCAWSSVLQIHA